MTADAAFSGRSSKWRVARETIRRERGVPGIQRAGRDHKLWIDKYEHRQNKQVCGDDRE